MTENYVRMTHWYGVVLRHVLGYVLRSLGGVLHETAATPRTELSIDADKTLLDHVVEARLLRRKRQVSLPAVGQIRKPFDIETAMVAKEPYDSPLLLVPIRCHK